MARAELNRPHACTKNPPPCNTYESLLRPLLSSMGCLACSAVPLCTLGKGPPRAQGGAP